MIASLSSNVFF